MSLWKRLLDFIGKGKDFTPHHLPELILWLDAADSSTITLDKEKVLQWDDKSLKAEHLMQMNALKRPTYQAYGINRQPSLRFDGGQYLQREFIKAAPQPLTVFAVYKYDAGSTALQRVFDSVNADHQVLLQAGNGLILHGGADFTLRPAYTRGNPEILCGLFQGAESLARINGGEILKGNAGTKGMSGMTVGANINGTMGFLNGEVAEILCYASALTSSQCRQIEQYLSAKWGIPLVS